MGKDVFSQILFYNRLTPPWIANLNVAVDLLDYAEVTSTLQREKKIGQGYGKRLRTQQTLPGINLNDGRSRSRFSAACDPTKWRRGFDGHRYYIELMESGVVRVPAYRNGARKSHEKSSAVSLATGTLWV